MHQLNIKENKIIGIGIEGNQIVQRIADNSITETTCISCDIDANELEKISVDHKILLGTGIIQHLSIDNQVEIGIDSVTKSELVFATNATINSFEQLNILYEDNSKKVILIANLGNTTSVGASPVIAQIAKKRKLFVVAIVYTPYDFMGEITKKVANLGLRKLKEDTDFTLIIKGSQIQKLYGKLSFKGSFEKSADIGIRLAKIISEKDSDLFFKNNYNEPFFIGIGESSTTDKVSNALAKAIKNTLSERETINGVSQVLLQINYGNSIISVHQKIEVNEIIFKYSEKHCNITVSETEQISLGETRSILVIAY